MLRISKTMGASRFFVEKFLSHHSNETFRRPTLLCFRKFLVSKKVRNEWMVGGGRLQTLLRIIFVSEYQNVVRGILLCFRKLLVSKMFGIKDGGCNQGFPSKLFCLTVPIRFVDKYSCVSKKARIKKIIKRGGGVDTIFSRILLPHSTDAYVS